MDGDPLDHPGGLLIALNKPCGYTCTHSSDEGATVYELVPQRWTRRKPPLTSVGRCGPLLRMAGACHCCAFSSPLIAIRRHPNVSARNAGMLVLLLRDRCTYLRVTSAPCLRSGPTSLPNCLDMPSRRQSLAVPNVRCIGLLALCCRSSDSASPTARRLLMRPRSQRLAQSDAQ